MKWLTIVFLASLLIACEKKESQFYRFPGGDAERGQTAFIAVNCIQCHTVKGKELPQPLRKQRINVPLGDKPRFVKNYEDLITAITNPQHVVDEQYAEFLEDIPPEAGISAYMPSPIDKITARQLMDLVTFLDQAYRKMPSGYSAK